MRQVSLYIFVLLPNLFIFAQVSMTPLPQYFNSFSQPTNSSTNQADDINFNPTWIDEVEFRSKSDRFNLDRQRYTLRVSPSSPNVRKAQKRVFEDLKMELQLEQTRSDAQLIESCYNDWLNSYFDLQEINLLKEILPYYDDLITLESKTDIDGSINVVNAIEASIDKDKLLAKIALLESNTLAFTKTTEIVEVISVADLETFVARIALLELTPESLPTDLLELIKIDHALLLEEAQDKKVLDFLQAEYQGPHEEIWEERVRVTMALRIPMAGENKLDRIELQIERMIEEEQIKRRQQELQAEYENNRKDFEKDLNIYRNMESLHANLEKYDDLIDGFQPTSKGQIKDILRLKIQTIEQKINLLNAKENVYEQFLDLLAQANLLPNPNSQNILDVASNQ